MSKCPYCRHWLRASRETIAARCPYCREPLYEWHDDDDLRPTQSRPNLCAVHSGNAAVGTCQRCGNYLCAVCWTRWRSRSLCAACVSRALELGEATPVEVRAHLRQAVLALIFGLGAWGIALVGFLVIAAGLAAAESTRVNPILIAFGGLIFMASPLAAVLGVGQAAAAIRARGNHMILATAGLIVSGLNAGVVVGIFSLVLWQR